MECPSAGCEVLVLVQAAIKRDAAAAAAAAAKTQGGIKPPEFVIHQSTYKAMAQFLRSRFETLREGLLHEFLQENPEYDDDDASDTEEVLPLVGGVNRLCILRLGAIRWIHSMYYSETLLQQSGTGGLYSC